MRDDDKGLLDRLKERGEEVFTQLSGELMSNRHFVRAMQGAMKGREKLEGAAAKALKSMNVPTRTEFKRALGRIEALEAELSVVKAKVKVRGARKPGGKARQKAK